MWTVLLLVLIICTTAEINIKNEEIMLYYYGLEESERWLTACGQRAACAVRVQRDWRAPALLRLCRCARRHLCPTHELLDQRAIELHNRAHFKFCKPITNWPECSPYEEYNNATVTIEGDTQAINPDMLEELHHKNIQLSPPQITFNCRCPYPNYWKLIKEEDNRKHYTCSSLPLCKMNDFCGNIENDLNGLYQSCLCPKNNICIPNNDINYVNISEILYEGKGRKAYCQNLNEYDYSYEDLYST